MAYQLKYYKTIQSHGHSWRLEIRQDTEEEILATEIGPVLQGLRLIVQGDQADIDTPIVKTSLEMVFVDAPDLETERKCGYWEEFYTSSATEYLVRLRKDGATEWSGYITPDSFSEDLRYRGSVTIIARDNLGTLQDFLYDGVCDDSGLMSFEEIVRQALSRIDFPMPYQLAQGGARKNPYCSEALSGDKIYKALFNTSSFNEKTWQEAIEDTLYALGLVMRFVGKNTFTICAIRDTPLCGKDYWWDIPILDTQFCAYGRRELSPAVKDIQDNIRFDITEDITDSRTVESAYGNETTYRYGSSFSTTPDIDMPIHLVDGGIFKGADADTTILLNPYKYGVIRRYGYGKGGEIHNPDIVYVCANLQAGNVAYAKRRAEFSIKIPAGSYKIAFEVNKVVALYNDNTAIGYADYDIDYWSFGYEAIFTGEDGTVKTLNNRVGSDTKEPEWQDGASSNAYHSISGVELPKDIESPVLTTAVAGNLVVKLMPATLPMNYSEKSKGGYLGIAKLVVKTTDNGGLPIMDKLRINTQYNARNNITLSRSSAYAPNISDIVSYKQIKNAIYVHDSGDNVISSEKWVFQSADVPQQLGVLIHQQLLAYYSKPNNVLTGELATDNPVFNALYEWNGKKHLLTSGALNILTGRMENAVLREFTRYDHMWETWVENEDIQHDYPAGIVILRVHPARELTEDDVRDLPSWLTIRRIGGIGATGIQTIVLAIMENATGNERQAIIRVDTAWARITQRAAGDYNEDYSPDYS